MNKNKQRGQGLTEYLMLVILISVISISAVKGFGGMVEDKIKRAKDHIRKDVSFE